MSTAAHCKQFVQNAWKKDLCSNCFKSKEEHQPSSTAPSNNASARQAIQPSPVVNSKIVNNVVKSNSNGNLSKITTTIFSGNAKTTVTNTTTSVKVTAQRKIQGILRAKETCQPTQQQNRAKLKKSVAFPESLIEIIGYDGGDDFGDENPDDGDFCDSLGSEDDGVPDSEEDRALGNLTRANTNFNTVTANLSDCDAFASDSSQPDSLGAKSTKSFASLQLGQAQVDAEGKKKTLLISVTPFGGSDDSGAHATAKRPVSSVVKKPAQACSPPKSVISEAASKLIKGVPIIKKEIPIKKEIFGSGGLEKIADMPLITSISSLQISAALQESKTTSEPRKTNIARQPAIKKSDQEKPRIAKLGEREVEGEASRPETRESVGEPDGKADEEPLGEPPALPKSPPPQEVKSEPRTSFLHSVPEKPVIPQKPAIIPAKPIMDQSDTSSPIKRRMAPMPPAEEVAPGLGSSTQLFQRNQTIVPNNDCPVVREKEKRERASSCSPKFRQVVSDSPDPYPTAVSNGPASYQGPESPHRKCISLSQDSLSGPLSLGCVDERKKSRSKFSIRKFLRMGTKREMDMTCAALGAKLNPTPQSKPRIEIIHPLDLSGAALQVVRSGVEDKEMNSEGPGTTISSFQGNQMTQSARPGRPPPPPRNQSLQDDPSGAPRPNLTGVKSEQQKTVLSRTSPPRDDSKSYSSGPDSIYANLVTEDAAGANRGSLAPAKPRRTSSMRDQTTSVEHQQQPDTKSNNNNVPTANKSQLHGSNQMNAKNLQDVIDHKLKSSSAILKPVNKSANFPKPTETNALELRYRRGNHPIVKRQSDSVALDSNNKDLKFQRSFVRSCSLPYCGSEDDYDIYSLYNDEGIDVDGDWKSDQEQQKVGGRLRQRRGRSIVHSSLEDNYGAVVVANHEALAQFLEQMSQISSVPTTLRQLKLTCNLQLKDFEVDRSASVTVGKKIFYPAIWQDQSVTLCVSFDQSIHVAKDEFHLAPIVDFVDDLPQDILDQTNYPGKKNSRATISVLPRLQVQTVRAFAASLPEPRDENVERESLFMLLQLVSALKSLQARGIEETSKNLSNIVLCREDKEMFYRLYLLESVNLDSCENIEEKYVSLCQCALNALGDFKLTKELPLIQELLTREKAVALSQVKSILEFSLWGPADATLGGPRERESALQRWLDLERATVLHALVRIRAPLTVTDEYQILFLVRTTAKIMCEASLHLDKQRNGLLRSY